VRSLLHVTPPDLLRRVHALRGINLSIGPGLFRLLGPNGAGKSSLMRTLATRQEPDAESIEFRWLGVLARPEAHRRHLGYLPQRFGVYARVPALDLLDYLAVLKRVCTGRLVLVFLRHRYLSDTFARRASYVRRRFAQRDLKLKSRGEDERGN